MAKGPEEIADGVWRLQGWPGHLNVYFVRDGDGVLMFDAGGRLMVKAVREAAASLGGLTRIVLGHGHTDHRGTAPSLGVPVLCHPDEVIDAEGSGGYRYWGGRDHYTRQMPLPLKLAFPVLHRRFWDGGPVKIAATLHEGDEIAGFRVVHLPGHAPGLIALWREADRLALVSDAFYTTTLWGKHQPAALPDFRFTQDYEQARASLHKLAALRPLAAWPGHADPVTGESTADVLRSAADA